MENKKIWIWVGVVVVVLGVVASFFLPHNNGSSPAPIYAAKGQLTPQFPRSLILHALSGVTDSYAIPYNASTNQYTAQFDSSSSVDFIYNDYLQYFISSGWHIMNTIRSGDSRGLYASTSTGEASVAIEPLTIGSNTASRVTIGYLTK